MEGDSKKWLIDLSPSENDVEVSKDLDFASPLETPNTPLNARELFINAATWMPMTVESVLKELWSSNEVAGHGYKRFLARASAMIALNLERLFAPTLEFNGASFSASVEAACCTIEKCLRAAAESSLEPVKGEILKSVANSLESLLEAVSRVTSSLSSDLCLSFIRRLTQLSKNIGSTSLETLGTWKSRLENSAATAHFRSHPDASVCTASLTLELDIILQLDENRPLPLDTSQPFIGRLSETIDHQNQIDRVLPVIRLLIPICHSRFIDTSLVIPFVEYLSNHGELDDLEALLKCVNISAFNKACIWNLRSTTPSVSDASLRVLQFWSLRLEYEDIEALLDEITRGTKIALSKASALSSAIQSLVAKLSVENQFKYLMHWLTKFAAWSDLAPLLTRVDLTTDVKPVVDLLEIGCSILHFVTPPKSITSSATPPRIVEIGSVIPTSLYHELVTLVLHRMDVPSYFYHLNETREFEKEKSYKRAEIRVRTFQHLIGHYWYILESLITHMPEMGELTKDNPILMLPEGAKQQIQFPLWFDGMLVTMAIHGIHSDFSTKDTIKDANHCLRTLLNCNSVKEACGNIHLLSLRIRSCLSLVKATKPDIIDEQNKFAINMWLCSQVPIQRLNLNATFDSVVFNAVISCITDALTDYRPKIKMLALNLVHKLIQPSVDENASSPSASPPPRPIALPPSIFDAIVKSLNFREEDLVELALKVSITMTKSLEEERARVARASSLMKAITYEMDYVQKRELLEIYLDQLKGFLPLLGLSLLNFSHPLLVRLVALLDVGSYKMTTLALENMFVVLKQTWKRIHLDAELVFGALAAVWIDQVLVLPNQPEIPSTVKSNMDNIKRLIHNCIVTLVAVVDTQKMESLLSEAAKVKGLESFTHDLVMPLIQSRKSVST